MPEPETPAMTIQERAQAATKELWIESVISADQRPAIEFAIASHLRALCAEKDAEIARLKDALSDFRDCVLNGRHQLEEPCLDNGRHQLEEPCLDNDQTNAVLGLFDDLFSGQLALRTSPPPSAGAEAIALLEGSPTLKEDKA